MKCLLCNTSTPEMSMLNLFTKRVQYICMLQFSHETSTCRKYSIYIYTRTVQNVTKYFSIPSLAYCCLGRKVVLNTCVYGSVVEPEPPGIGLCLSGA